jgi:hypothetical protein
MNFLLLCGSSWPSLLQEKRISATFSLNARAVSKKARHYWDNTTHSFVWVYSVRLTGNRLCRPLVSTDYRLGGWGLRSASRLLLQNKRAALHCRLLRCGCSACRLPQVCQWWVTLMSLIWLFFHKMFFRLRLSLRYVPLMSVSFSNFYF